MDTAVRGRTGGDSVLVPWKYATMAAHSVPRISSKYPMGRTEVSQEADKSKAGRNPWSREKGYFKDTMEADGNPAKVQDIFYLSGEVWGQLK